MDLWGADCICSITCETLQRHTQTRIIFCVFDAAYFVNDTTKLLCLTKKLCIHKPWGLKLSDQADVGVSRSTTVQSTMLPAAVPSLQDSDHNEATAVGILCDVADSGISHKTSVAVPEAAVRGEEAAIKDTEACADGTPSVKKSGGRRIWDKVMACCFCPAVLKNKISKHLTKVHSMESDVARILLKKPVQSSNWY